MTFSAILFDLFDTLVLLNRNRLPEVQINGSSVRSTAGHLFPILAPHAPGVDLPQFFEALSTICSISFPMLSRSPST